MLKGLVVVIVAFLVLRFLTAHRKAEVGAAASSAASAAARAQPSANGFVALPEPFTAPTDRLLILAPPNCPSQ